MSINKDQLRHRRHRSMFLALPIRLHSVGTLSRSAPTLSRTGSSLAKEFSRPSQMSCLNYKISLRSAATMPSYNNYNKMERNMQQREERLTGRLDTIQGHQHELRQEVQQLRADTAVRAQAM
jgi:hypothetical protein